MITMNPMREIRIEKLTLNIGCGKDQQLLEKGLKLLKIISGVNPVKTFTNKRIPEWGVRPGLPIGCKITLRDKMAKKLLKRLFEAKDNVLTEKQIDNNGNISFGIPEYIDIPEVKYDPDIGVIGLEVCVTLDRPGFRIRRRQIKKKKISKKHAITREESAEFIKNGFGVKVGEKE